MKLYQVKEFKNGFGEIRYTIVYATQRKGIYGKVRNIGDRATQSCWKTKRAAQNNVDLWNANGI